MMDLIAWLPAIAVAFWLYKRHQRKADERRRRARTAARPQSRPAAPAQTSRPAAPSPYTRPVARPAAPSGSTARPLTWPVRSGETITYYAAAATPTEDNEYRFEICQANGKWRAYIKRTPSYGSRDTGAVVSHWHFDSAKGKYVCVAGGDPTSMDVLLEKTMRWADRTQRYIRTGRDMNAP